MCPHYRPSPATSTSWPYSYTYNLHQAKRLPSSPWSAVTTDFLQHWFSTPNRDYTDVIQQLWLYINTPFVYDSLNKTWNLNLSTCLCHLPSPLSITTHNCSRDRRNFIGVLWHFRTISHCCINQTDVQLLRVKSTLTALTKETRCYNCGKIRHFSKVCRSSKSTSHKTTHSVISLSLSATLAAFPDSLSKTIIKIRINGVFTNALLVTGISENYITDSQVKIHKWHYVPSPRKVTMANIVAR